MTSHQCHDPLAFNPQYPPNIHSEFTTIWSTELSSYEEWWRVCHDFIVEKAEVTREIFQLGLDSFSFSLRLHSAELLYFLHSKSVPCYIVSAGFTDIIHHTLDQAGVYNSLPKESIGIYANYLVFEEHWDSSAAKLLEILPVQPVHSRGKHLFPLQFPEMFNNTAEQVTINTTDAILSPLTVLPPRHDIAIILGDSPGDFEVVRELTYFTTFKIGFAATVSQATLLLEGKAQCDVVLCGKEHGMLPVLEMMQDLLGSDQS
jgi:hypothetical protein